MTIIQISESSESLTADSRKLNCVPSVMQHSLTQPWKTREFDIGRGNLLVILKPGLL